MQEYYYDLEEALRDGAKNWTAPEGEEKINLCLAAAEAIEDLRCRLEAALENQCKCNLDNQ